MIMKSPTMREKIRVYEALLHHIQINAEIVMNQKKVGEYIEKICHWSYAHRVGNGEFTEKEQQGCIDHAFWKLDADKK